VIKPRVPRDTETLVYTYRGSHYILGRPLATAQGRRRRVYRIQTLELIATVPTDEAGEQVMRFDATRLDRCARCSRSLEQHPGAVPGGWSAPITEDAACAQFTAPRGASGAASEHRDLGRARG